MGKEEVLGRIKKEVLKVYPAILESQCAKRWDKKGLTDQEVKLWNKPDSSGHGLKVWFEDCGWPIFLSSTQRFAFESSPLLIMKVFI